MNPLIFKSSSTPIGNTNWQVYEPGTVYVDVDTSTAAFSATPYYFTSLGGYHSHNATMGATSINNPTANGFTIYIRNPDRPDLTGADANAMGWHVIWIGIEKDESIQVGSTLEGETCWESYEPGTVSIEVATGRAGFASTPYYFAALGGQSSHYKTLGTSSINDPEAGRFFIYIRDPNKPELNKAEANAKEWHVSWLGIEKTGTLIAGSTPIRSTAWQIYGPGTIYADVEFGCSTFNSTPFYITSLGGYSRHYKTQGATSVYYPKSNGFRIYIRDPKMPNLSPSFANQNGWHIRWLGIEQTKWNISPWWNNGILPEIGENAPLIITKQESGENQPLQYPSIWERERECEKIRYNPRFLPHTVSFDRRNRPVIRVGVHDLPGRHATVYHTQIWIKEVYIQTLNDQGNWIARSIYSIMQDKIADWNGDLISSGIDSTEERVAFDGSGDAYTIVKTKNHGDFLLHSRDDMENWDLYALPVAGIYRIEMTASHRPPVIFVLYNPVLSIIAPDKKADGRLENLNLINLVTESGIFGAPLHAGLGDLTVTVNNKTQVVYGSKTPLCKGCRGTPQYVATYNHADGTVTGPLLLGTTESVQTDPPEKPKDPPNPQLTDRHNGPAIAADSDGFLHVVLGAHAKPFKYTVSSEPNDSTSWTAPVEMSTSSGKESYVSLVIDSADTLHLVARMNDNEGAVLHYMQKRQSDTSWVDKGKLVVPGHAQYSNWYHKLTIDKRGRLFLTYFYYAYNKKFTNQAMESYRQKWPEEEVSKTQTNAHDPVILMSSDGGDTWRITTTKEFQEGVF